jgi:flagellar hook-length control protein FliK
MTNLPISSNKPQPSGNAANAPQANIAADGPATDVRPAGPFAFLLAQQIGAADLSVPDAAQTVIAIDGNVADNNPDPSLKEAQDQAAATPNIPGDPANILAAILMQLPAQEGKGQKAEGKQTMQPFVPGLSLETGRNKPMADSGDHQTIRLPAIDHLLPQEAAERAELLSGLAQPAPNTAQAIAAPVISAAMPVALTNNTPPANIPPTISTPLGNHRWAEEFSQKISWISTQQNQIAELHLNPPNLGPLDVVLKISDNQATALFASPHGAVRDAVENALPKLRELLADNGIMLGNTTISDQSPRDRSMNEFMNQGSGTGMQHEVSGIAPEPAGSLPVDSQIVTSRRHNGMVDTFA